MPAAGNAVIALGNSSNSPIHTTLQFSSGEKQELDIAPFATTYVRRSSDDLGKKISGLGFGESVRIKTIGAAGSLKAVGYVISSVDNFTGSIRFYETPNAVQQHLFATNFRVKNALAHVLLKNTSESIVTAAAHFRPNEGERNAIRLPAVALAPGEIKELDLQPLKALIKNKRRTIAKSDDLNQSVLPDQFSIYIENSGAPGSLIGALYSTDQTTGVTQDIPLRDSGVLRNSTGAYPWRLDDDYQTLVSITNVGSEATQFIGAIHCDGGRYMLELRELAAGQTAVFDMRKIRDEQIPDQNGNVIPLNVTGGQFRWSIARTSPSEARLIGRSEVVSRSGRVSISYSCPSACPNRGPYYSPLFFDLEVGDYATAAVERTWYDSYETAYVYAASIPGLQTADSSVATAVMQSYATMRADGIGVGDTYWFGDTYHLYDYVLVPHNDCEDIGYDTYPSGEVAVRPKITDVTATGATKISQVLGDQSIIHFVTPKGAANSQVTLTATISPNTTQVLNKISWEGATESANNPLQATLTKDTASKNVIKIKYNGNTIKELRVWVVWATITSPSDFPIESSNNGATIGNPPSTGLAIRGGYRFNHTIAPATIITDTDRPDFCGNSNPTMCVSNINPPPGGNHPIFINDPLSGGANKK